MFCERLKELGMICLEKITLRGNITIKYLRDYCMEEEVICSQLLQWVRLSQIDLNFKGDFDLKLGRIFLTA